QGGVDVVDGGHLRRPGQRHGGGPARGALGGVEGNLVGAEGDVVGGGGVEGHGRGEQGFAGQAGGHVGPGAGLPPLGGACRAGIVIRGEHVGRLVEVDRAAAAVAVVGVVEHRAVAVLLGAVVLRAAQHQRVGGRVLADELELRDAQPLVDAVVPVGAPVGRAV